MDLPANYHQIHLEGTMEGWYQNSTMGPAEKAGHWVTFLCLAATTLILFVDSWKAKGPGGRERFYAGYHEEYNISLLVNLFAMIAYFGKIVADTLGHNYSNVGPVIIGLGNYRYADYMLTCPLLAYDLLCQVRGPYKITGSSLIFAVLLTGAATNFYPGDEMRNGAIAWFGFGCVLYTGAYALFVSIVKAQYERLDSLAKGTEAKKAFLPLRLAIYTFFSMWVIFPIVWVLGPFGLRWINSEMQEILHCVLDILAKSFYGFALMRYRNCFDKKLFDILEELGYDGEEHLASLENDLKSHAKTAEADVGQPRSPRVSLTRVLENNGNRRLSAWDAQQKENPRGALSSSLGFADRRGSFVTVKPMLQPRLGVGALQGLDDGNDLHSAHLPRDRTMSMTPRVISTKQEVDRLQGLVEIINAQIRSIEANEDCPSPMGGGAVFPSARPPRVKLQSPWENLATSSSSGTRDEEEPPARSSMDQDDTVVGVC